MKYTTPPEGHRWHNPENASDPPEGWRFLLNAEVAPGGLPDGTPCRLSFGNIEGWSGNEDASGEVSIFSYIVPETTPFNIPEARGPEGSVVMAPLNPVSQDHGSAPDLTKREWFAGMAMPALIAKYGQTAESARESVWMADALIAALNQKEEA